MGKRAVKIEKLLASDEEKYLIETLAGEKIDVNFVQSFIFPNVTKTIIQKLLIPFSSSTSLQLSSIQFANLINIFQRGKAQ